MTSFWLTIYKGCKIFVSILQNSESLSDFHCTSSLVVRRYVPNKNHYSVRFFFSSNKACCYVLLLETDYRLDWAGQNPGITKASDWRSTKDPLHTAQQLHVRFSPPCITYVQQAVKEGWTFLYEFELRFDNYFPSSVFSPVVFTLFWVLWIKAYMFNLLVIIDRIFMILHMHESCVTF